MQLLQKIDFLSYKPTLFINSHERYRNIFGGIISIIIILLSLLCLIYFGLDLFLKSVPNVIISKKSFENIEVGPYPLSDKNYSIFTGILTPDQSEYYIDESIYKIWAQELSFDGKTLITKNLTLGPCSELYDTKQSPAIDWVLPWEKFHCIQSNNSIISGSWGSGPTTLMKMYVDKCVNSTESPIICKPDKEIDKLIQGGYITTLIKTYEFFPENYLQPL
jgi:hypothetical protein